MRLRLEGTGAECEQATALLGEVLDVVSASDLYPNRGRVVWSASTSRPISTPSARRPEPAEAPRRRVTLCRLDRKLPAR